MARPARQIRSTSATGTTTTTLTLENPSSSRQQQPTTTLTLTLNPQKKKVTWKEGTVDNEFMQKKSSKKCCIFHKEKPFDEDDSDDDDGHDHVNGCCGSKDADGASSSRSGCSDASNRPRADKVPEEGSNSDDCMVTSGHKFVNKVESRHGKFKQESDDSYVVHVKDDIRSKGGVVGDEMGLGKTMQIFRDLHKGVTI